MNRSSTNPKLLLHTKMADFMSSFKHGLLRLWSCYDGRVCPMALVLQSDFSGVMTGAPKIFTNQNIAEFGGIMAQQKRQVILMKISHPRESDSYLSPSDTLTALFRRRTPIRGCRRWRGADSYSRRDAREYLKSANLAPGKDCV